MDKVEYNFTDNTIGISIKRPNGLRKKWSESYIDLCCKKCQSTNLRSSQTGEGFVVACMDCENFTEGSIQSIARWSSREEAFITAPPHFDEVDE